MGYKKLKTIRNGDTSLVWKMQWLDKDGNPISLAGVDIICQFRKDCDNGLVVRDMSVGNGITITDEANAFYEIDQYLMDWGGGFYVYDIQFTLTNGIEKTPIFGDRTVINDVTKKV